MVASGPFRGGDADCGPLGVGGVDARCRHRRCRQLTIERWAGRRARRARTGMAIPDKRVRPHLLGLKGLADRRRPTTSIRSAVDVFSIFVDDSDHHDVSPADAYPRRVPLKGAARPRTGVGLTKGELYRLARRRRVSARRQHQIVGSAGWGGRVRCAHLGAEGADGAGRGGRRTGRGRGRHLRNRGCRGAGIRRAAAGRGAVRRAGRTRKECGHGGRIPADGDLRRVARSRQPDGQQGDEGHGDGGRQRDKHATTGWVHG